MIALTFDPDKHEYRLDSVVLPHVTEITDQLVDFSMVAPEVLKKAQRRGQAVHFACELDDKHILDEESVHPNIMPYLQAWRKFKEDTKFSAAYIEERIFSRQHGYAGTLDRAGSLNGKRCLIDLKARDTITPEVALQTAAYSNALSEMTGYLVEARYALQLKSDGSYRLTQYKDPRDISIFLAALNVHKWRQQHVR